ncbi:MAG TPA: STAS domain-containing protein [Planctomycetota bacterium]|nr:STAS domain-containing protein [Planctomycetota bacterium]
MSGDLPLQIAPVPGISDAVRVTPSGPLDARSVPAFQAAIHEQQQKGMKRFILDMTDVKFVNSTGLSFLINLSESLGDGLHAVTLVDVQPKVKIIFDTMGVSGFFKTAKSADLAVKDLQAAPASKPATVVKRDHSSTKTGRVSPPTSHEPPRHPIVKFFRKLFGRS